MTTLAERLKQLRKKRNFTLAELEEKARVSKSYIHDIERGKRTSPSLSILKRLAQGLGVPLDNLLESKTEHKYWITELPPDIQGFVKDKDNIEYVRLGKKMKDQNIAPELIDNILQLISKDKDS